MGHQELLSSSLSLSLYLRRLCCACCVRHVISCLFSHVSSYTVFTRRLLPQCFLLPSSFFFTFPLSLRVRISLSPRVLSATRIFFFSPLLPSHQQCISPPPHNQHRLRLRVGWCRSNANRESHQRNEEKENSWRTEIGKEEASKTHPP